MLGYCDKERMRLRQFTGKVRSSAGGSGKTAVALSNRANERSIGFEFFVSGGIGCEKTWPTEAYTDDLGYVPATGHRQESANSAPTKKGLSLLSLTNSLPGSCRIEAHWRREIA